MRERSFSGLRNVDFVRPLLRSNRIAVQRIDDRVTALLVFLITRRQKDNGIAIDNLAFEISFQCRAVDLDVFHRDGLCARHRVGNDGLHLSVKRCDGCHRRRDCTGKDQFRCFHLCLSQSTPGYCTG